jgi:eukaryotic-like serine/threonine-protein kinase
MSGSGSGSGSQGEEATAVVSGAAPASAPVDAANDSSVSPGPGKRLGRYLVIGELGRGGMGLVLRAYDPKLQREVALKCVRTDALGSAGQARLVREARSMARLNHPNVVGVYDVEFGEHDEHDVILVMEYVRGTTLRTWLEAQPRSSREIVEGFVAAGRGLMAAHKEGLLHRDFKLDNVLVGEDGRVRVTDFGLARTVQTGTSASEDGDARSPSNERMIGSVDSRELEGVSVELTEAGAVMGTPRYMAPEQYVGLPLDARTDQYAFCVGLWRALAGRWPFEARGRALFEAKRAGPPAWPSNVAIPRHVVDALRRGLSPDPAERWPSLETLLLELQRDPSRRRRRLAILGALVLAGVGTWGLQAMQRARTLTACVEEGEQIAQTWNDARADAIAAAFEGTGISFAADTWMRARTRLDAHAHAWSETRRQVCERAEVERTLSPELGRAARACLDEHREHLHALLGQLAAPNATAVQKAATASASLPLASVCTDETRLGPWTELPDDMQVRDRVTALRSRLSDSAAALVMGQSDDALEHAQTVLEEAMAIGWSPLLAEARLAVAYAHEGLGSYEEARAAAEETFFEAGAIGREELALQASTKLIFIIGNHLAQHDEALHWGRLAQMLLQRTSRSDNFLEAGLLASLGSVHSVRGEHAEALESHERALAIREKVLGSKHLEVAKSLNSIAIVQQKRGESVKALEFNARALAILEETLGPEHPQVALSLNNIGTVHQARGEAAQAFELWERALAILERALGPEHPQVAMPLYNLGVVYQARGEAARAFELYERAQTILEKTFGSEHPSVATVLSSRGALHSDRKEYAEALELNERVLDIREKALGPEHHHVAQSLHNLGVVHKARGEYKQAVVRHERALPMLEKALGPEHPELVEVLNALAAAHDGLGAHTEAALHYERALDIQKVSDTTPSRLAYTRFGLARSLWDAGQERDRAIELATAAANSYRSLDAEEAEALAEVEAWLQRATRELGRTTRRTSR